MSISNFNIKDKNADSGGIKISIDKNQEGQLLSPRCYGLFLLC